MERDEALRLLRNSGGYIRWDDALDQPCTRWGSVNLDGTFTELELVALLKFLEETRV